MAAAVDALSAPFAGKSGSNDAWIVARGEQMVAEFGGGVPALGRFGGDGWQIAEPLPMGRAGRRAFQGLIRAVLPPAPAPRSAEHWVRGQAGIQNIQRGQGFCPCNIKH